MKLYIKYMVSLRCNMVVQNALDTLKITVFRDRIRLGRNAGKTSKEERKRLAEILREPGLQLLDDKKYPYRKNKNVIIEWCITQMNLLQKIIQIISVRN